MARFPLANVADWARQPTEPHDTGVWEQEIRLLAEQEAHRASVDTEIRAFRASVEAVLRTMSDSASEMGRTAAGLSASSRETSQRASGAVRTSNDAAVNVKAASDAARELTESIVAMLGNDAPYSPCSTIWNSIPITIMPIAAAAIGSRINNAASAAHRRLRSAAMSSACRRSPRRMEYLAFASVG